MRAILCSSLVLCSSLALPRSAFAQTIPTVPEPTCQCPDGPHAGEWILCDQANDYCGGGSSGEESSNPNSNAIEAMAAFVAVVIAPVFTFEIKRDSAKILAEIKQAEVAWGSYRDGIEELEQGGIDWAERRRQQRQRAAQLDRDLRAAAADKPARDLPPQYQWIPPAGKARAADRWAAHGYCTDVLQANDELPRRYKQAADLAGSNALPIPTLEGMAGSARKTARDGVLAKVGPAVLQAQAEELSKVSDELKEYYAFLTALQACVDKPTGWYDCVMGLATTAPSALRAPVTKLVGKGTAEALERVRVFTAFYKPYVTGLQIQIQQQAIAATRCR